MTTVVTAEPGLRIGLAELAAALWPEVRAIEGVRQLSGGASRVNWAFDAVCDDGATPLVLRMARPLPAADVAAPAVEAALLRLARQADIPAPAVRLVLRPENGLGDGFVMERVPGAGLDDRDAGVGASTRLDRAGGHALARIHHIAIGTLPPLRSGPAAVEIARCLAPLRRERAPQPVHDRAFDWLQRQAPGAPIKPALVHGDFRAAKLRGDDAGLHGVLDWKSAHLGDPMEDLGRLCVDAGAAARAAIDAGYEDAGGRIDPERVRYWEVFCTLQRALRPGAADVDTEHLRRLLDA